MAPLAFITGASSGIGQALALAFAGAGYRLALVARRAEQTQAWATSQGWDGERCRVYAADVQDVDALAAVGARCIAEQGLPAVVIANAGISVGMDTAEREDLDVMRETLGTNTLGVAATFHPFLRGLARANGRTHRAARVDGLRRGHARR